MKKSYFYIDNFSKRAKALRSEFDKKFEDPRRASSERFVWDYWNIPDQYALLRTPAYHYFSKKLYEAWHKELVHWGRENLGCHDISPTWLSLYNESCFQNLHADNPHGPWAFVYSLTPWTKRKFSGGETLLLKDQVLDYWSDFDSSQGFESEHLLTKIPPKFNRLVVFDPRIPHGVSEVRGERDPRFSRLVLHGWFVNPRPFVVGSLSAEMIKKDLSSQLQPLIHEVIGMAELNGVVSLRLTIANSGTVKEVKILTNSLKVRSVEHSTNLYLKRICAALLRLRFPRRSGLSRITLPLNFEN